MENILIKFELFAPALNYMALDDTSGSKKLTCWFIWKRTICLLNVLWVLRNIFLIKNVTTEPIAIYFNLLLVISAPGQYKFYIWWPFVLNCYLLFLISVFVLNYLPFPPATPTLNSFIFKVTAIIRFPLSQRVIMFHWFFDIYLKSYFIILHKTFVIY